MLSMCFGAYNLLDMKSDYSKLTDFELIDIIKKNKSDKQQAFAEIYVRYSQKLYTYCLRMSRNIEDAKDLYQETFVKFYNSIHQKNDTGSLISYLITIARNMWLNDKRKQNTVYIEDKFANFDEQFEDERSKIDIWQKELEDIIPKALMKLNANAREIIILRLYEGLRYDQIEEITGISGNLLRNRFSRAKEKLRIILTDFFDEE